jgi:hypothetical protein
VFQPENVYPLRVKEFDERAEDEDADCADIEPDPELALNVTDLLGFDA